MTLRLSAADAGRLSAVAEALLTPVDGAGVRGWALGVERRLRELFPGTNAIVTWPEGDRLRFESETLDDGTRRRLIELSGADTTTGLFLNVDPAVTAWHRWRREQRVEVWSDASNRSTLARLGFDFRTSTWYNDGLVAAGLCDFGGISTLTPTSEFFLCYGYDRFGRQPLNEEDRLTLLALLLPAVRAGHHALAAHRAQQPPAGEGAAGDASEALLVTGADGRVVHRTPALGRLLLEEPERERVEREMAAMAGELVRLRRRRAGEGVLAPGAVRTVVTAHARWTLRASYVTADPGDATVRVAAEAARLEPPPVTAVVRTLGLTRREAEVARLLARRMSDAELAAALGISWHTARRHSERVLQKLGVDSRTKVGAALLGQP
ncbi:MAG TPA: LuxR C-terminal-related transcriptional regulator [Gemmatimonadales bacterium]|nr:LuxR C-terminal-related transcriptional regulator [Gemmatimonadales bacterium]